MPNPFSKPVTILGQTIGRRAAQHFGQYQPDRWFHTLILGQTGTGKSTLIHNMIVQDIDQGNGFCLIDPHGDLSEALRPHLRDSDIYWDIADPNCAFGYNPLGYVSEHYRPLVASALIDALKKQWSDAWGPRMEHLLRYALLALLSRQNSSLADIVPMFTSKTLRTEVLRHVTDSQVLTFWRSEFPKMNYKGAPDGLAPIANKLGAFLSNPVVREKLCNPKRRIKLRTVMDEGRALVINLNKGQLGNDICEVVGGLILSQLTAAAMSRSAMQQSERRAFYIYVDESTSFTTDTLANMLSELRKFRVGLILSAQYLQGIKPSVQEAIFGNVGTLLVFRLGISDADTLSRQLSTLSANDLMTQPNHRMAVKLMVVGDQSVGFSAQTLKQIYRRAQPLRSIAATMAL